MATTVVTATQTVTGDRTCSRCKHVWRYEIKVGASEESWTLNPKSDETMEANVRHKTMCRALDVRFHYKVICPECGRLCIKTRDRFFRRSFARAFEELFRKKTVPLAWMLGSGAVACVFALMGILVNSTSEPEGPLLPIPAAIVIGCLIVAAGVLLGRYVANMTNRGRRRAMEYVQASSEDELEQIVMQVCTKHNGNMPVLEDPRDVESPGGIDYWAAVMNRAAKTVASQRS